MRIMKNTFLGLIVGLGTGLIIFNCQLDHGLEPLEGRVEATIIFRGDPPINTEGLYMTVAPQFPPRAINEMFHSPNSIPFDQDTVEVSLDLPLGSYEAFLIWWYGKSTESNLADILYIYPDPIDFLKPGSFELTREEPVFRIEQVNLIPQILNRPSELNGTVNFNGPFPDNTWVTAIAAFSKQPQDAMDFFIYLNSIDFSVGPTSKNYNSNQNLYHFRLPIRDRIDIEYLIVLWFAENADLSDYHIIGQYNMSLQPKGYIDISYNTVVDSLNIQADWVNIQ